MQKNINISDMAMDIMKSRYLINNETPLDMFYRVAKHISSIENNSEYYKEKFYNMMINFDFLPNSPCLMGAGTDNNMLFACFVLPIKDNLKNIFKTLGDTAWIFKLGGGVGINFSNLRSKGAPVGNQGGDSSGALSFMEIFNSMTDVVKQGGKRKGALMGVLNCDHPDIEEFINYKKDVNKLKNFNISVGISDKFMEAALNNKIWELIDPKTQKVVKRIAASDLFMNICKNAWESAEPGVLFLDRINKDNPFFSTKNEAIITTNPCGEQPLLPYEACVLGSINLSNHIKDKKINFEKLTKTIKLAVRFLDNCIDLNLYPLPEIEKIVKNNRKIGLGIMGYADLLVKLGIRYGSNEAITITDELFSFILEKADEESKKIGIEKGYFPNNIYTSEFKENIIKRRNCCLLSIAPTGTISTFADCSSGIEPYFGLAYYRNIMNKTFSVGNSLFVEYLKKYNKTDKEIENILYKIIQNNGCCSQIEEIPDEIKFLFITSGELTINEHINTQAIIQKYVDAGISKTINMDKNSTVLDVYNSYIKAWKDKCKGITVYRDGCRGSVLTTKKENITNSIEKCPECNSLLDGIKCKTCNNCGWSKCSL